VKVLVVTQHFVPELTAGRFRLEPFVAELVARGHEVDVVCAAPNHPQGVIEEGYRGRLVTRRDVDGADVHYVWLHVRPKKSFRTRLATYGTFAAMASAVGSARRRPDVVLASSPPLTVGAVGRLLGARYRVPWVLDVRDIWPDSAIALGELSNERAIHAAERLELGLYRSAEAIVTVNDAFRRHIVERAPAGKDVEVITNGTTRAWLEAGERPAARGELGLPEDRFVWTYAGNIGLAHGLDSAVRAAAELGEGHLFVVIGDGPKRAEAERLAAMSPGLVRFLGVMDPGEAARYLRASDAVLVSESQRGSVASKLYDYAAIARPIVAACRGELRRVIAGEGLGVTVDHGDASALAQALAAIRDGQSGSDPERLRAFAREHLRENQAEKMAGLLERLATQR
jgi:glycosyltransferase involved in cell wall biosynthesis